MVVRAAESFTEQAEQVGARGDGAAVAGCSGVPFPRGAGITTNRVTGCGGKGAVHPSASASGAVVRCTARVVKAEGEGKYSVVRALCCHRNCCGSGSADLELFVPCA